MENAMEVSKEPSKMCTKQNFHFLEHNIINPKTHSTKAGFTSTETVPKNSINFFCSINDAWLSEASKKVTGVSLASISATSKD